jgi:hypothetical protein
MTYFNEDEPYWGNTTLPVIGSASDRLSARSVKIFADGVPWFTFKLQKKFSQCCRGPQDRRCSGRACIASLKHFLKTTHDLQLYEAYSDNPSTNGLMRLDAEVMFDVIPKFLRDGWQVVWLSVPLSLSYLCSYLLECTRCWRPRQRNRFGRL